ncbi:hypothetical protein CVT26_011479 [Gymnopilus dilepis]|uniref:DNA 3'-5' helicase n=1 Tax=Gymnopilus dilepis TaxID=231916 RepID=A0A409YQJ6_9AGAR|nr:hypothetical protein CVT26_011479 [Gymnopilus dilepis]
MSTQNIIRLTIDVARIVERFMDKDQIGMIFCMSKEQADTLHNVFTRCSSHSDRPQAEKLDDERRWKAGIHRWIATTTGMIQGIDAPNVGATIFLDMPYGLLNLYQGAGRGGRDGRRCYAIVLNQTNCYLGIQARHQITERQEDKECYQEGENWMKSDKTCHRYTISELMDGQPLVCNQLPGCHKCNVCDNDSLLMKAIQPIIKDAPPQESTMSSPIILVPSTPMQSTPMETTVANRFPAPTPTRISPPELSVSAEVLVPSTSQQTTHNHHSEDEYDQFNLSRGEDWDFEKVDQASQKKKKNTQSANNPPLHLHPPTSTEPSMQILRDTSFYHQQLRTKDQKKVLINRLANMLYGKCPVCWAQYDMIRYRHDLPFKNCGPTPKTGFVAGLKAWMDLKHMIHFTEKYFYCWKCQFPQNQYRPSCHPDFSSGERGNKKCPLEDLAILIIWTIRWDTTWWARAVKAFPDLPFAVEQKEFANWIKRTEGPDKFYNGLELILWFYIEKTRT